MRNTRFMKFISVVTLIGMLFLNTTVYANDSTSTNSDVVESSDVVENNEEVIDDVTIETPVNETGAASDTVTEEVTEEVTSETPVNETDAASEEISSSDVTATDTVAEGVIDEVTDTVTEDVTDEVAEEIDPGTTPDQTLYFFDRLLEEVQLAFTFDEVNKAALLASITEERKAEVNYLITKAENEEVEVSEWEKLLEGVVSDYVEKLEETLVTIEEVSSIIDDEEKTEFDAIIKKINNAANLENEEPQDVNEEIHVVIEEIIDENEELQEAIEKAIIVANVVQGLDKVQVTEMRDQGLGFGQISQVFALAEASGKEITEVASLFIDEGMGFGDVSKELGLSTSEIAKSKALKKKLDAHAKAEEKYQKAIEKIEKKKLKGKKNRKEEDNAIEDDDLDKDDEDNAIEDDDLDKDDEVKIEDKDENEDEDEDDNEKKSASKKNNPKENKKKIKKK